MGKPQILIIEDEPSIRGLLASFLSENYGVLTAKSGAEGCALFDTTPVSLVLLDMRMAEMDGVEVLRRVRGKSSTVPVIVMTGYSTHDTAVKCADLGVQGYILKPPKLEDLKRRIDSCLGINNEFSPAGIEDKALDERLKTAGLIVKGALKVIHDRFRDPALGRTLIAEVVGVSDDYLSKQFQKDCGISMPEYINRLRISEAGRLLASTNTKISEIALTLGFSNVSYFSSIFKKHSGVTPEQYRREKRIS